MHSDPHNIIYKFSKFGTIENPLASISSHNIKEARDNDIYNILTIQKGCPVNVALPRTARKQANFLSDRVYVNGAHFFHIIT